MKTTTNYSYDFMRNVTKIETKDESGFLHERVDYDYMYDSTKRKLLMKVEKRKHCTEIVEFINNGEHTKKIIRNIDYKYNDNGDMITSICDEEIINNY